MSPRAALPVRSSVSSIGAAVFLLGSAFAARSDTLAEAIAMAYQSSPTLQSQRAQLMATDEDYVQAYAGFRPQVSAQISAGYSRSPQAGIFGGTSEVESNQGTAALSVNQPIYTGGKTTAAVSAADAEVRAGREQLRAVESSVILAVVQAYCDVRRDRESLKIQRESYAELKDAVQEIHARREAGANTETDVTQAEAQLAASDVLVASAEAQLDLSVAEYVSAVGQSPGDLEPPPPLPAVPDTIEKAFDVAEAESPSIRQAQFTDAVGQARVQEARAARRPTVTLSGGFGYTGTVVPFTRRDYDQSVSVSATVSQPIFAGGAILSQIRQASAQEASARLQIDSARRTAIQGVAQAWSQRHAALLITKASDLEVRAAQAAFDGTRVEYRAGLRTTLDVLIAQETLRDAEISAADARHDSYVAEAGLLSAVGRLEARVLLQGVPLYQPQSSLRKVERIGGTPFDFVPEALDKIGSPKVQAPAELPSTPQPGGPVRMSPAVPASAPR